MRRIYTALLLLALTVSPIIAQKITSYAASKPQKEVREIGKPYWFSINGGFGIGDYDDGRIEGGDWYYYDVWVSWQHRFRSTSKFYYGADLGSSSVWIVEKYDWEEHSFQGKIDPTIYVMPKIGMLIPIKKVDLDISVGAGYEYGINNNTFTGRWGVYDKINEATYHISNYIDTEDKIGHQYGVRCKFNIGFWYKHFGVSLSYSMLVCNYKGISYSYYTNSGLERYEHNERAHCYRGFINLSYRF